MSKIEVRYPPELLAELEKDLLRIIPEETIKAFHKLIFENY